jgi:enoyl-CoA hydratase/carnithine racemase
MSLTIKEVFAKAGDQKIAHVVDGPINYMVLNTPFNMIDMQFIDSCNNIIDTVEASKGEAVLVTIGSGKCFCSGFNLKMWANSERDKYLSIVRMNKIFARLITLSVPSLAVFNGHSIAGGIFLGLSHDQIICKNDPSLKLQLNELEFGGHLPYGFTKLLSDTTSPPVGKHLLMSNVFSP